MFIEMYFILLIISSIVFSTVDDFNLKKQFQFKKQNEKLLHYEGEGIVKIADPSAVVSRSRSRLGFERFRPTRRKSIKKLKNKNKIK